MSILPAKILQINITSVTPNAQWNVDDGSGDPFIGFDYRWNVTFDVTAQPHSSHITPTPFFYTGLDINVGDWICTGTGALAHKVISITTPDTSTVTCIVEDVDRFNTFSDPTANGNGGPVASIGLLFSIAEDGIPILDPTSIGLFPDTFVTDLISRFRYRNYESVNVSINQPGHTFSVNDVVYIDPSDELYKKSQANSQDKIDSIVGIVNSIGTPGPDYFTFRPLARIVNNISPVLPAGNAGTILYVDPTSAGGLTSTKPATFTKPIYIKIDSIGTSAMLVPGGGGSGSGTTVVQDDTTPKLGGDLDVNSFSIISSANGDIKLIPNGTGVVQLGSNVTAGLIESDVITFKTTTGLNGNINFLPDGTGKVNFGNILSPSIISSSALLTIKTDTSSNANITIIPDGTGNLLLNNFTFPKVDGTSGQVLTTNGSKVLSWSTATGGGGGNVQSDTAPKLGGNLDVNGFSIVSLSNANINVTPNGTGKVVLKGISYPNTDGTSGQVLTTNGSGILSWTTVAVGSGFLQASNNLSDVANNQTSLNNLFSGSATINSTAGAHKIRFAYTDQSSFPSAATYYGSIAYSQADSALFFADAGGSWIKLLTVSGGVLTGFLTLSGDPVVNNHAANKHYVDTKVSGLLSATTPILQGNFNVSTFSIISSSNGNINITPNGTGKVVISGLSYPSTDGTSGQVLTTNGSGVLGWGAASSANKIISTDTNTYADANLVSNRVVFNAYDGTATRRVMEISAGTSTGGEKLVVSNGNSGTAQVNIQAVDTSGLDDVNINIIPQGTNGKVVIAGSGNSTIQSDPTFSLTLKGGDGTVANGSQLSLEGGNATTVAQNGGDVVLNGGQAGSGGSIGQVKLANGYVPSNTNSLVSKAYVDEQGRTRGLSFVTTGSSYNLLATDQIVEVNKTSGSATTIILLAGNASIIGKIFSFKDGKGDAATNTITLQRTGTDTIEGSTTLLINTNRGKVSIYWNGTQWNTI